MKVCYYLAAIGNPYIETKLSILINNLRRIRASVKTLDLFINSYDNNDIETSVREYVDNIYTFNKEGFILAEFWLKNPHNDKLMNYDYIILILDDVVFLENFDFKHIIERKEKYNIDIISPKIHGSGYNYFNKLNDYGLCITSFLEMFCYIMTPTIFLKYLTTLSLENKWTCGNDLLLEHFGFVSAIEFNSEAKHVFRPTDTENVKSDERMTNERDKACLALLQKNGYTWDKIFSTFKTLYYI